MRRALLVIEEQFFPFLWGAEELETLRSMIAFPGEIVSAAALTTGSWPGVEFILSSWGMPPLTEELLARLPDLRVLFHAAGTVKGIVTAASWARGIRVTSAAAANAKPVAEFAFAQIILALKRVWPRVYDYRAGKFPPRVDPLSLGAYGSTVGLVGLGHIGRLTADRLRTLEVSVLASDPLIAPDDASALGVTLVSMPELFARSNVVSCHLPLTPATRGVLNGDLFDAMPAGATFINTSRGAVVEEAGFFATLQRRPDLFAILDVIAEEPPGPDHPIWRAKNVAWTPHIAGSEGIECRRMGRMMVGEVARFLSGSALLGEVLQPQLVHLA